ncbi:MAG: proteasome assembly chaperone family protein [Methanobacterium sp.]
MNYKKKTYIKRLKEISLNKPIFIEGLPGVGLVGKLVAEHLIYELNAEKFAELYSSSFPPQVLIDENGIIEPMKNEFYCLKSAGVDHRDFIILTGNTQGLTPEGHNEICSEIIDFIDKYGVKNIYTLGGCETTQNNGEVKVLGSGTSEELTRVLKDYGVKLRSADGNIIGASGLLLTLGMYQGMDGVCLMGKTHGYTIDIEASTAVLKTLISILKLEVDISKLNERVEESNKIISKTKKNRQDKPDETNFKPNDDDLRYIR